MVSRLDSGPHTRLGEARRDTLGVQLRPARFTADGAAVVQATLTRTGVFVYLDEKGEEFREYRPPEEVFDETSMRSFEGVPVTDDHPSVLVDARNVSEYKRGRVAPGIKRDGIHMVADLIIDDEGLLAKMKRGKLEISNGYTCDLEMTPGVSPEGERYHAIQRNIRGNHTAVVDFGRAGTARARIDGAAIRQGEITEAIPPMVSDDTKARLARADAQERILNMEELQKKLGEALAEVAKQKADADAAKARADKAEGERDAANKRADAEKTRADKAEGDRDAANKRADAVTESLPALTKARGKLEAVAMAALGADAKVGDKAICDADERALKIAVVQKIDGDDIDKDPAGQPRSPIYVDARFDGCAKRVNVTSAAGSPFDGVREVVLDRGTQPAPGAPEDREAKARAKMHEDSRNAHKMGKE
jgi:hypothetical protein